MAKSDYLNPDEMGFAIQLKLFKNTIGPVAATLDVTPAEVAQQAADADYYEYVVVCHQMLTDSAKSVTAFRNRLRHAKEPGPAVPLPVPTFPPPLPAVAPASSNGSGG